MLLRKSGFPQALCKEQQTVSQLRGGSSTHIIPKDPKKELAGLSTFLEFNSHPWTCMHLTNASAVFAVFCISDTVGIISLM